MSITKDLNPAGIVLLAGGATFLTNLGAHPLCTLKNHYIIHRNFSSMRELLQKPLPLAPSRVSPIKSRIFPFVGGLYAGLVAYCITDIISTPLNYLATDYISTAVLKDRPCLSAALGGLVSCAIIAPGEGVMIQRQNGFSMIESIRTCITLSGFFATICREIPYNVAVLAAAQEIEDRLQLDNKEARQALAGSLAGAGAGVLTVPFDTAKTIVQARKCTLREAFKMIIGDCLTPKGRKEQLVIAALRVSYVSLSGAIQHLANRQIPTLFPESLKRVQE